MIGVISIGCYFPFLSIVSNSLAASGGEDADLIGAPPWVSSSYCYLHVMGTQLGSQTVLSVCSRPRVSSSVLNQ